MPIRCIVDPHFLPELPCPVCGKHFSLSNTAENAECRGCFRNFMMADLMRGDFASGLPPAPLGVRVTDDRKDWSVVIAHRSLRALFFWAFIVWCIGIWSASFVRAAPRRWSLLGVFLIVGVFVLWKAVMQTWGSVILSGRDSRGSVFEGVGRFGQLRALDLRQLSEIHLRHERRRRSSEQFIELHMARHRLVQFGTYLDTDQLIFLAAYLLHRTQAPPEAI